MEVNRLHVDFDLQSSYEPKGDQVNAIRELTEGLNNGEKYQTLLGATGTGKTFTIANIVKNVGKPTLVLAHNKTLAGQLYNELKEFFPNNRVEYFVSYYEMCIRDRHNTTFNFSSKSFSTSLFVDFF